MAHTSSMEQKVKWLLSHPELWEGIPSLDKWDVRPEYRDKLKALRVIAVQRGLYSPTSYYRDVEVSLLKHIGLARKRRAQEAS